MASRLITDCDPRLQNAWAIAVPTFKKYHSDITPFLTCTHRPDDEQDELFAQGRTRPGNIVTNAKAGQSAHNTNPSGAFDVAFKNADGTLNWSIQLFLLFADIIKGIDPTIVSGSTWNSIKDWPHFETPDWRNFETPLA